MSLAKAVMVFNDWQIMRCSMFYDIGCYRTIKMPKTYMWEPKEDITAYELALCLHIVTIWSQMTAEDAIAALPANAQRHFKENGIDG